MNETMTPTEAVRVLDEARGYEGALLRRTEGLTWMIWGIATPGVFLTYAFASVLGGSGWWMSLLWVPWIAMGVVATTALWRSLELAMPGWRERATPAFWLRLAGFMAAFSVLFWVLDPQGPEVPLMVVGGMWAGMGIVNLWSTDSAGRVLAVVAGGIPLVAGAAFALLQAPIEVSGTAAIVLSGLSPFLAGLWRVAYG